MNLQAIKGKVTGKQSGKSMLVRSLSGIGETAAMIVGAPSANGAFSEDDLLRMRIADNIGNASDQQIMQMMTMQHIVVSVPAGTEIYVIFEKSQQAMPLAQRRRFTFLIWTTPRSIRARQYSHRETTLGSRFSGCGLLSGPHFLALSTVSIAPIVFARRTKSKDKEETRMKR